MPGTYTRSNGEVVQVDDLDYHHAKSARDKLLRTAPERVTEIADLAIRVEQLEAEWQAAHPGEV